MCPKASRPRPHRLWQGPALRQLMLVSLLGFSSFCLTLAALPSWAVEGGVSSAVAGSVTTVMLLTTVCAQLALPAALRRWGTARVLALGLLALGAPAPLLALSHDLTLLLPVSAVRGVGFAVLTVVGSLLTTVVAPQDRHGEAVGLYGLAIAVPNLLAVPGGVALTQAGWFWVVAALGAAPVLGIPAAVALGRGHRSPPREPGRSSLSGPTTPTEGRRTAVGTTASPGAVLFATTLAAGGLVTYLPIAPLIGPSIGQSNGSSNAQPGGLSAAVVGLLVFGLTGALARWRAGVLADRLGLFPLLPGAIVTAFLGVVAVAAGLFAGSGTVVVAGAFLFGVGYGAVQNLTLVSAFARAGPAGTTTASSVWNAAFDAGTGVGAVLLGALAASGLSLPGAFLVTALLILLTTTVAPRR